MQGQPQLSVPWPSNAPAVPAYIAFQALHVPHLLTKAGTLQRVARQRLPGKISQSFRDAQCAQHPDGQDDAHLTEAGDVAEGDQRSTKDDDKRPAPQGDGVQRMALNTVCYSCRSLLEAGCALELLKIVHVPAGGSKLETCHKLVTR